jgi:nitrite reductase (NADH) small subunit
VGREDDFPLDTFRIFELAGRSIGVAHTTAGWYAIRNRCPHQGAPLCQGMVTGTMLPGGPDERRYGLKGRVLRCPWHGWEYDLEDGRSLFVDGGRAATYPVQVSEGTVSVMLPARRGGGAPRAAGAAVR